MINTYNRKIVRSSAVRQAKNNRETMDAVLWDVLSDSKICRVKIQGSDELIYARYPENWGQTPLWLKPGNAVKILHTSGNRNNVEIIGDGIVIPTPEPGSSGDVVPDSGGDTVIAGMNLTINLDTPTMEVSVDSGSYRINGIYYTVEPMTMSEDNDVDMGSGYPMDQTATTVTIPAAEISAYRFDIIVVGTDGIVEVVSGEPSLTEPIIPYTPATHVLLGWVLVPPGATSVTASMLDASYTNPTPTEIRVDPEYTELYWDDSSIELTFGVYNQYGVLMVGDYWTITSTFLSGSGTFPANIGTGTDGIATATYNRVFGYQIDIELYPEEGPVMLQFGLAQAPNLVMLSTIILRNELGAIIWE